MISILASLVVSSVSVTCSGDITSSLQGAIDDCHDGTASCIIEIGEGTCSLSDEIDICYGVEIYGASDQHTTLTTAAGDTAFHVQPYTTCQTNGDPWVGDVRIERMTIRGPYAGTTTTAGATYGVHAEGNIRLKRLNISYFTQGVRLVASVHATPKTNANLWTMDEIRVFHTDHAGIFIDGSDVNAGLSTQLRLTSPMCKNADDWQSTLGDCAGLYDDNFLGNTHIASHTAGADGPGYVMSHASARNVMIGAYSEIDQDDSEMAANSIAIGGHVYFERGGGVGTWFIGNRTNGFIIENEITSGNHVELELGEMTNVGGTYWAARALGFSVTGWPLRFKADAANDRYKFDVANLEMPMFIQGVDDGTYDRGTLRVDTDLFIEE